MVNEQGYAELGLSCTNICGVLDQGMDGMKPDDLIQSVREAINQLMTWAGQVMRGSTGSAPQFAVDVLRNEVNALKDANKALSLYASKILDQIIAARGFGRVLAVDCDEKLERTPAEPSSNSPPPTSMKPCPQSSVELASGSGSGFTGIRRTPRRGKKGRREEQWQDHLEC